VHEVVISPFLGDYLAVRPGARNGVRLPQVMYADACQADTCPGWLAEVARAAWGISVSGRPMAGAVLVRDEATLGFGRASYELNLGCNYDCEHCYLGLKQTAGLSWEDRARLLTIMRDAGVLWLQLTGGCFRTRRVPQGTCLIRLSSAVARDLLSGLCRGAVRGRWRAGAGVVALFGCAGLRAERLPVS
jgi:hypothetical protein